MLVKRNPVFSNIFDDLLRDLSIESTNDKKYALPAVNIKESENEFTLTLAAPGRNKKDFIIDVIEDVLSISTEKTVENEENNNKFTLKEYNYHAFKRSFNLPKDRIDSDKIKASYKNGELILRVPKKEIVELKPKLIEVK
jgi:HSP20 family protein